MFQAYTKDHYYYGATINSVLPKTRYKNNELSKAGIVTIGCLILLLLIYKWIDNLGKRQTINSQDCKMFHVKHFTVYFIF